MTGRNDDPREMNDEEMIQELDRAMGEFFAMERQLEQQLTQTSTKTLEASAKAMDHFMGLLFK